jgi:inorganic triphosphatase YgiF
MLAHSLTFDVDERECKSMKEIEVKLQVPISRLQAVERWVAHGRGAQRTRLQAAYFDTPDRGLARAAMALRLRLEGSRWVQTLKGELGDGLSRAEHEVPLEASPHALPELNPSLHRDTPIGQRLLAVLAQAEGDALQCRYRTDILRTHRPWRNRWGQVELALDVGQIESPAQGLVWPVCELELEYLSGHPRAVQQAARLVVGRWGLWLDNRSKAERGDLLARGLRLTSPTSLQARWAAPDQAWQQVLALVSPILTGEVGAEQADTYREALREAWGRTRSRGSSSSRGWQREPACQPTLRKEALRAPAFQRRVLQALFEPFNSASVSSQF